MTLTLPPLLLFGYWGSAPAPWLLILSSTHSDNAALIAHEQCHQAQQRRDGTLRFWWRYLTSKPLRLAYEAEAYRVWIDVAPEDRAKVTHWLAKRYGFNITHAEAAAMLS